MKEITPQAAHGMSGTRETGVSSVNIMKPELDHKLEKPWPPRQIRGACGDVLVGVCARTRFAGDHFFFSGDGMV